MKKIFILAIVLFTTTLAGYAALKPIAQKIADKNNVGTKFLPTTLFETSAETQVYAAKIKDAVSEAVVLQLDYAQLASLYQSAPSDIEISLPISN